MAHAAAFKRIMQNLRGINHDMDKFEASDLRFNAQLSSYFENIESEQPNHTLSTFLKEERPKLLSIATEFNSKSYHHSTNGTPNARTTKSKLNFSSKKKPRPTVKRTPLKVSTAATSNVQNIHNFHKSNGPIAPNPPSNPNSASHPPQPDAIPHHNHNPFHSTIPQKITLKSLSSKPPQKMNVCHDSTDSENDENMAPSNLLGGASKSLVQEKLEEQNRKKQTKKKLEVDALQKAKRKRLQDEQKERERQRQKEINRQQIAENKRKKRQIAKKHNANKKMVNAHKMKGSRNAKKIPIVKRVKKIPPKAYHKNKKNMKPSLVKQKVNVNTNLKSQSQEPRPPQPEAQAPTEYEISDYDSNFSDSDLDEENCGKFIPTWAKQKNPVQQFARQNSIDPDTIFGRMYYKSVDLEVLFKDYPSRTKYRNRSASGDWSKDQITWAEENGYKKSMGWCK